MIGQKEVLKQIDNSIEKGFPRFIVITGAKGQGKTELAKYISKKLNIQMVEIGIKIDDIREMIQMSYKQTEPIIYLIQNADKMSLGAKNSLLKVIEEPPNNAYFIMELQQIENTLETIKSRCQEIKMEQYSAEEITQFINEYYSAEVPSTNRALLLKVCCNKYQVDLVEKYNVIEFYSYVDKVYENIYKVQSANSFKISEKLDLKDDGNGYDLNLFWKIYCYICIANLFDLMAYPGTDEKWAEADIVGNCIQITSNYLQKLKITGINKQMLVDNWIIEVRKEWLQ